MPSSPPPSTPGRSSFPTPSLTPLPFGGAGDLQVKKRWALGTERLREVQKEYHFSEATIQRTLKAKQALELSAIFKKLLEIEEHRVQKLAMLQHPRDLPDKKIYEYNPLRVIRNRKLRNRKKIHLDASQWEDPGAVEQWVEDVAAPISSPGAGGVPRPPPGNGRKLKRPKMDWIVEPEEMLADYYWMRCEESKREERERDLRSQKRRSVKSIESMRDKRVSLEVPENDVEVRPSDEDTRRKISTDSPRKRRMAAGAKDYRHFLRGDQEGFESTATSSDEDGNSDSDYLFDSTDTEPEHDLATADVEEDPKHHRRRRKLGRMIKGHHHGKKKKKKLKQHELEMEEKRRMQESKYMDWIPSETEERGPIPVVSNQPEYRKSMDIDEEYESAPTGRSPSKLTGRIVTGFPTIFGGSKSSLERFTTGNSGLGIAVDRADFVVPSINISLSPPRVRSATPEIRDDDRRDGKVVNPTKKLLSIRKEGFKEKDFVEDSGRESLDMERYNKKPGEKEKSSAIGKVMSRVDKLRNEVSRVEDLIPWKRGDGTMPSPTASSFTASDDEDQRSLVRQGTLSASEREDHEKTKLKSENSKKSRPPNHRSRYSVNNFRRSFDSDRSISPERRGSKLREPLAIPLISRERSPMGAIKFDAFRRKADGHLGLSRLNALQPPLQQFSDALEEPTKQTPPRPVDPSPSISKCDIHHARAKLIATGIVARGMYISAPSVFNPRLRSINTSTNRLDTLLGTYNVRRSSFMEPTAPRYHSRVNRVSKEVSQNLTPAVRAVADEADLLSTRVTTELTLNVKKLQDEIFSLARRRKGRGKMRLLRRMLWGSVEWMVVVLLWVVWSVFLAFRIVRGSVTVGVRMVRWVLWL
ncbi:hypothetical protein BZA05DRAFT_381179 [Tricharina praecox]|uniref:uncharacterized protein n=1 Tax=Tricharina praecox TaxID=43433 RepID=UPI00221E6C95|nr:uncharacterized protein BZA05DRAFT_381179 [Tricharina praecox]KAI5858427.1 hypothetical protein BZA05DRAFT_381179 [Tricharina praecox]